MLLLAFDTSMSSCSACVYDAGASKVLAAEHAVMDKGQAEALAPMVRRSLQRAGVAFGDLSRIVVTTGPGTFTGVRIGLAFARGLGVSLQIPVIGINSLRAIAANETSRDLPLMVAADARGGNLHLALFTPGGAEVMAPALIHENDVAAHLPAIPHGVLGTAADRILLGRGHIRSPAGDLPIAENFASLGSDLAPTDFPPEPLYLRPRDVKLPFTLVNAGADTAPLLAALHSDCFASPWDTQAFAELLRNGASHAILAATPQVPLGFVLFRSAADEAEILTVCTRPTFRRQGISRALLDAMEKQLALRSVKSIFIEVGVGNSAAQGLYAAVGYVVQGVRPHYYEHENGVREDAHIMRKDLAS